MSDDATLRGTEGTVRFLLKSRPAACERLLADAPLSHGLDAQQRARLQETFVGQIHADRTRVLQAEERNARADERIVQGQFGYYAFRRIVVGAVPPGLLAMLIAQRL